VPIVAVLQSFVQACLGGVYQFDAIAGVHQSVDDPIPVERAFHCDTGDIGSIGLERPQCHREIVWQALLDQAPIVLVDQRQVMVV
jgi:hypothetical protein